MKVEVEYDGKYPNMCSGTLTIIIDGKEIYSKKYCCDSTGLIVWKKNHPHIRKGKLVWIEEEMENIPEEYNDFKEFIKFKVEEKLRGFEVCCGGCI